MRIGDKMNTIIAAIALTFLPSLLFAQKHSAEMADNFRGEGKINIVILVIVTIFIGIIIYLVYLDRKIKRLEDTDRKNKH